VLQRRKRSAAVTINNIDVSAQLKTAQKLLREDSSASPQLRAMIELLVVIIDLLVAKLGTNSTNSSLPPSRDPHRQRGSKKRGKGKKRKPGGQQGHNGNTLTQVENPDETILLNIDRRTIPSGDYTNVACERRQVIDIHISRHVTEYQAEIIEDAAGNRFVAPFPPDVTRPVQYGNSVKTQSVYMSQQQLVPYDRVRNYFADQCGIPISCGTLVNFNKEAFDLLEPFEAKVKEILIAEGLLHADETGININGKLVWLHSLSNDLWTLFFPHAQRGAAAMTDCGVLPHFHGRLCHDHWKPYFQFSCLHSLCNAHHLRELQRAWEQDGQRWAKNMKRLLLEINEATTETGGTLAEKISERFRQRYRRILARGDKECPPPLPQPGKRGRIAKTKSRNLLERLRDFEAETLCFMTDPLAPFSNNRGENDIRMTKVQQKISGCFRSFEGAEIFCRIRSYLSTCAKQGFSPTDALTILFSGGLPEFITDLL
jgi:transposase